jgi:hypothetical protein
VFEKCVLRRIFEPKRDEITEDWENCVPRNKELNGLYSSPNVVRVIQ